MKFSRQQIEEQELQVWELPNEENKLPRGRKFAMPEEVDTDAGTIVYWTVAPTDKEELLAQRKFTEEFMKERAPVDSSVMVLKSAEGLELAVLDASGKVVAKTDEERSD